MAFDEIVVVNRMLDDKIKMNQVIDLIVKFIIGDIFSSI